jgi:hypothetical protein
VRALRELRQAPVDPDRAGTAAGELLRLWRAIGRPPIEDFADDVALVARAAQVSRKPIFSRDVRGEGTGGDLQNRMNDVGTLTVQRRWDDRLVAAREWEEKTGRRVDGVALCLRQRWPERGHPEAWERLDPPRPLVEEYLRIARQAVGDDGRAHLELDEVERSGGRDGAAASSVVSVVLRGGAAW